MAANALSLEQQLALGDEIRDVVELSRRGIAEMRSLPDGSQSMHVSLQLLAQGFERLLKLTLALSRLQSELVLPTRNDFKKFGHSVVGLSDEIVNAVKFVPEYANRSAVRDDLDFMTNDAELRQILVMLSAFGKTSRYFKFDKFLDPMSSVAEDDPQAQWDSFELNFVRKLPDGLEQLANPRSAPKIEHLVTKHFAGVLERYVRAVVRMWTLGAVHPEAQRHTSAIGQFLFLRDSELGGATPGADSTLR